MTPTAILPSPPAANSTRNAPAAAPGNSPAPNPFDQHLQAARSPQPPQTPADKAPASTPAAHAPDRAATPDAATKPAQESNVPTLAATAASTATPAASMAGASATVARAAADVTPIDAALLASLAPPVAVEAGDATFAAAKPADATKTAEPGEQGAATLAGALLAMLGQVANGVPATSSGADDAAVSMDGAGQAKAAALPQGMGLDDKAAAAALATATPAANLAVALGNAEHALASNDAGTHKDHGLEALALATAPAPTPAPATPTLPQLQLSSPPGSPGFAGELGQQVLWLGQQDIKEAKIRLHPEDLGSIDVHLSVSHDRVDVVFSAQHPAAVTAVQQSLPQLDHLLARHGLALGHAEVGQQQNRGDQRARGEGQSAATTDEIGEVQGTSLPVASNRISLLDAFA